MSILYHRFASIAIEIKKILCDHVKKTFDNDYHPVHTWERKRRQKGMTRELPKHLADANLTYVSHSQLEKPACLRVFEYLHLKEKRRDMPVGVPATAGGAAHDAIQSVICDGLDIDEAIAIACKRIQEHQPISELDDLKRIQYIEDVEHIVRNGVAEIEKLEG